MTPHTTAPTPPGTPTDATRAITEIGPYAGSTSLAVGAGIVFVSADGTWRRPAA